MNPLKCSTPLNTNSIPPHLVALPSDHYNTPRNIIINNGMAIPNSYYMYGKDSNYSPDKSQNYIPGLVHQDLIGLSDGNSPVRYSYTFNPRVAQNMTHVEKVNNWITKMPIYQSNTNDAWICDCYPATLDDFYDDIVISMAPSLDEIKEIQARRVTLLNVKLYQLDRREETITPELQQAANIFLNNFDFDESQSQNKYEINLTKDSILESTTKKRKARKH